MVISQTEDEGRRNLKDIFEAVQKLKKDKAESFLFFNAMKCPKFRLNEKFRFQIFIRLEMNQETDNLTDTIYDITETCKRKNVTSYVEVNPSAMY